MAVRKVVRKRRAVKRVVRRRNPTRWTKVGSVGWKKGNLGVTYSYSSQGYYGSTPTEDGPILPTLAAAKRWAETHAAKANPRKRTVKRVRRNPLPPRNAKGRFMKRKSNPRKRRTTKRR